MPREKTALTASCARHCGSNRDKLSAFLRLYFLMLILWYNSLLRKRCHGYKDKKRKSAQPARDRRHDTAKFAYSRNGALRLRKVVVGLRHALCGRPAPLCRIAFCICAAVPRQDGEAGRRENRGSVPGDFHRAAHHEREPPLHRRDCDGDTRLPANPLRRGRRAALPEMRQARNAAVRRADRRFHPRLRCDEGDCLRACREGQEGAA